MTATLTAKQSASRRSRREPRKTLQIAPTPHAGTAAITKTAARLKGDRRREAAAAGLAAIRGLSSKDGILRAADLVQHPEPWARALPLHRVICSARRLGESQARKLGGDDVDTALGVLPADRAKEIAEALRDRAARHSARPASGTTADSGRAAAAAARSLQVKRARKTLTDRIAALPRHDAIRLVIEVIRTDPPEELRRLRLLTVLRAIPRVAAASASAMLAEAGLSTLDRFEHLTPDSRERLVARLQRSLPLPAPQARRDARARKDLAAKLMALPCRDAARAVADLLTSGQQHSQVGSIQTRRLLRSVHGFGELTVNELLAQAELSGSERIDSLHQVTSANLARLALERFEAPPPTRASQAASSPKRDPQPSAPTVLDAVRNGERAMPRQARTVASVAEYEAEDGLHVLTLHRASETQGELRDVGPDATIILEPMGYLPESEADAIIADYLEQNAWVPTRQAA